jgi:hypothetical protein
MSSIPVDEDTPRSRRKYVIHNHALDFDSDDYNMDIYQIVSLNQKDECFTANE